MKRLIFLMFVVNYAQFSFGQIPLDCRITECNCELTVEVTNSIGDFNVEVARDYIDPCFETMEEGIFTFMIDAEDTEYAIYYTTETGNSGGSVDVRITGCGVEVNETLGLFPFNLFASFYVDTDCPTDCDNDNVSSGFGCEIIHNLSIEGCNVCFTWGGNVPLGDIWTRILVNVDGDQHIFVPGDENPDNGEYCFSLPGIGEYEISFEVELHGNEFLPCGYDLTFCVEEDCCKQFPVPDPDEGIDCELGSFCINCDGSVTVTGSSIASKIKVFNATENDCDFIEVMGDWNGSSACKLCNEYADDAPCDGIWTFPAGTVTANNNVHIEFQSTIGNVCGSGYTTPIGGYYNLSEQYATMFENGECFNPSQGQVIVYSEENSKFTSGVQIYPNPASDYLKINSLLEVDQVVQILNTNGQELMNTNVQQGSSTISLTGLAAGIYYIHVFDESIREKTHVERIVILK